MQDDTYSSTSEEKELEELGELLSGGEGEPTSGVKPTPDDIASTEAVVSGNERAVFPVSARAHSIRNNPTIQKVVQDIRAARTPDELATLMSTNPNEVPEPFIEEAVFDYALVENGDTTAVSPLDVASAIWVELHNSSSSSPSSGGGVH